MGEAGALMRHIDDVGPSGLLEKVELYHDFSVFEALVKRRGCSVVTQDLGGQIGILLRRGVLGELDVIDYAVNDLRLC